MSEITILLAYVPVLHRGYVDWFKKYEGSSLYLFGDDIVRIFPHLRKDIRALEINTAKHLIKTLNIFSQVEIADLNTLEKIRTRRINIVLADDDISRSLAQNQLNHCLVKWDTTFLRWDNKSSLFHQEVLSDRTVSLKELAEIVNLAYLEANKSSDFWRQVGAVAFSDNILLASHNHHVPTEYESYFAGDPRGNFSKGVNIEISTAIHAEASLIGAAANKGIQLSGTSLFCTTFPCPPCAKLIVAAGFKRLFFCEGYSMVGAFELFKENHVEIIHVQ